MSNYNHDRLVRENAELREAVEIAIECGYDRAKFVRLLARIDGEGE